MKTYNAPPENYRQVQILRTIPHGILKQLLGPTLYKNITLDRNREN